MRQGRTKRLWVLILLALLGLVVLAGAGVWLYVRASLAQLDGSVTTPGLAAEVTVTRDARGVPLISGTNRGDVAYATGFVHAQERFFQMDLLRRVGAGELSELFGERALPRDRANRLHRFRARAERALAAMTPAERQFLDRYVAGINAGLNALSAPSFEYALVNAKPRPWVAADTLLVICAMYFDLQSNIEPRELARGWFRTHTDAEQLAFLLPESSVWDAPLDAESIATASMPIPALPPAWWGKARAPGPQKSLRTPLSTRSAVTTGPSPEAAAPMARPSSRTTCTSGPTCPIPGTGWRCSSPTRRAAPGAPSA